MSAKKGLGETLGRRIGWRVSELTPKTPGPVASADYLHYFGGVPYHDYSIHNGPHSKHSKYYGPYNTIVQIMGPIVSILSIIILRCELRVARRKLADREYNHQNTGLNLELSGGLGFRGLELRV